MQARRGAPRLDGHSAIGAVSAVRAPGAIPAAAAALPLLALALVMMLRHAPASDVARFTGFTVLAVALPGFVLWRLLGGYRRNLVEDAAAGFAAGTAVQLIVYLVSAPIGLQRWSWAWAPVVLLVAALHPEVRSRVWRRVEEPLSPLTAWLLAAACAVVLVVIYRSGPDLFSPGYTNPTLTYPDLPFHQALAASAKYDVPIKALWVAGEPMKYHTFFHQLTAANAWGSGVDLSRLIYSLAWLPLVLAGSALVFVLTQRVLEPAAESMRAAVTWAGPLAVVVAGIGGTLQPLAESGIGGIAMASSAYLSPTQNLGVMLALGLAVLAVDLLRGGPPWTRWVLLILVAVASSGAKATVLPLALCGFGLAFLVRLPARQQVRTALVGGVAMLVIFIGSVIAVFGGESSGLQVKFAAAFAQLAPYGSLREGTGIDREAQLLVAAVCLVAWGLAAGGILFVRRRWSEPGTMFLAGFAIAGFVAMLLTSQPGVSEIYFYRTAFPVIAVLSCLGLAELVDRLADRRGAVLVALGAALGLAGCAVARAVSADVAGVKVPTLWTLAALAAAAALLAAGWRLTRNGRAGTAFLVALVSAGMAGACTVPLASVASDDAARLIYGKPGKGGSTAAEAAAARWLRDNSDPDDLVATNAHCSVRSRNYCDSRHFWLAALSERQVLVEGWAYTNRINNLSIDTGKNPILLGFWDQERLKANDAVFKSPSPTTVERLRQYGVRWLYADKRAGAVSPNLKQYARQRFTTADVIVYELN